MYDAVVTEVKKAGLELFELSGIEPNPRIDSVRKGAQICKKENNDVLLVVGGGSTLDATKYMAAGACVYFDPWDFLGLKSSFTEIEIHKKDFHVMEKKACAIAWKYKAAAL